MLDNEIFFSAILDDRKWKLRKWKKRLSVPTYWTIPESFKTIHWTISEKTVGQKEKKNNNNKKKKKKQYDYKKVFRLTRKTLIKGP